LKLALLLVSLAALVALPAEALEWRWSYQGEGVTASGAFTTKDAPNADGFYEITGINGEMNGVAITGLQPAGTSIPGNDGYPVDSLVRTEAPQLSLHGFGYALADGSYGQSLLRRSFRPAGRLRVFFRSSQPQDERAVGEIHRDDRPLARPLGARGRTCVPRVLTMTRVCTKERS
jgi:hypothetical protein